VLANAGHRGHAILGKCGPQRQDGRTGNVQFLGDGLVGYAVMSEQQEPTAERNLLGRIAISHQAFEFQLPVRTHGQGSCGIEHASV
jgi:hypothetical protein